ncbi:MAG: hypothetical protein KBI46_04290 [Phycisphaerae bacterium]|nr:hypothetical protein [Phycisphaerae bacterium]
MMNNKEHLEELLLQFMDRKQAVEAAREISDADRLFDAQPLPALSRDRLSAVQAKIRLAIEQQRRRASEIRWFSAAASIVAAALLVGLYVLNQADKDIQIPASLYYATALDWNRMNRSDDSALSQIENELRDVAESMKSLSEDTFKPVNTLSLDTMELDEIESLVRNTEFWKG